MKTKEDKRLDAIIEELIKFKELCGSKKKDHELLIGLKGIGRKALEYGIARGQEMAYEHAWYLINIYRNAEIEDKP